MLKQLSKLAIRLKAFIYLSKCGRNLRIGHSSHIGGYKNIIIGDNFFSGPFLYLNTNNISSIRIGSDVMLGPDVKIISGNHITTHKFSTMNRAPEKKEGDDKGITIEDDIWIGAGAMILGNHIYCSIWSFILTNGVVFHQSNILFVLLYFFLDDGSEAPQKTSAPLYVRTLR